mmetsp:Transcript_57/g.204  ORF Transcript_57/g.204 Transcript_57/m.204 type:complete len:470 (-) Transcript_57:8-1417(-)
MASTSSATAFCDSSPRWFHSRRRSRSSASRSEIIFRMSSLCLWFFTSTRCSSSRMRRASASDAARLVSNSTFCRRASTAICRSMSRICVSRATIISCCRAAALRASSSSRLRSARSPSSNARFARSASSSAFLSASFSCIARSFAISASRASAAAASSSSRARRFASSCLRYSTILRSSWISSSFRFFLMRMASSLAASTAERCAFCRSLSFISAIFSSSACRSISSFFWRCSARIASRSFFFSCSLYSICRSISERSLTSFSRRMRSRSLCTLICRRRSSSISMSRTRSASRSLASRSSFSAFWRSRTATVCAYRSLRVIVLTSSSCSSRWCADSLMRASLLSFSSCSSTVSLRFLIRLASNSSMCALRAFDAARVASSFACCSRFSLSMSSRLLITVLCLMRCRSLIDSTADTGNASRTVAGGAPVTLPPARRSAPLRALPPPLLRALAPPFPNSVSSTSAPYATVR